MNFDLSSLKGKTCIITGGTGGIGSAIVDAVAGAGINLVLISRSKEKVEKKALEMKSKYNIEVLALPSDVNDRETLLKVKESTLKEFGSINYLINCAGGNFPKATAAREFLEEKDLNNLENTFFGLDLGDIKKVFDLNFIGSLLPTLIFADDMVKNKNGSIINISSMNAFRPLTKIVAYSAAKASINNFTQWLAVHLARVNVRVNAVAPGFFLTDQNRFLLTDEKSGNLTERGKKIINLTPMQRFGNADELQGIILFLLSDYAKFITGTIIPVDGGFSAYSGV
jgi:NAD(P)-dependent dehydrogenase (short-subunit alcohol dehydrogenase family)